MSKAENEAVFSCSTREVYVLVFRGHILSGQIQVVQVQIINIPFIKKWFKFYRKETFLHDVKRKCCAVLDIERTP